MGIYFEETAILKVYHSDWHITLRLDLNKLEEEKEKLNDIAKIVKDACINLTTTAPDLAAYCIEISNRVDTELAELDRSNAIWFHHDDHRQKRGLINAIGEVSKTLFGTLTQEDASIYLNNFKILEKQGKTRDEVMLAHTTLLESSLSLIESTRNESFIKLQALEDTLTLNLGKWHTDHLRIITRFQLVDATTILLMLIASYKSNQEKFLQALAFGGKNDNVALLIPPRVLADELLKISSLISGQSITIPAPINEASMPLYYQIGTARSRIINNQLILSYAIPLPDTKEFYLSKVTSFPHKLQNGYYNFIIPNHDFIAVDAYRQKFLAFTNSEISNCHDYQIHSNKSTLLCKLLNPILDINPIRDDCEITLLTREIASTNCDNRVTEILQELWIKLRANNQWIYVFPQKEVVYITCTGFPRSTEHIQGAGILAFSEDCEIKSGKILVQGYKTYRTEVFSQIIPYGTIDIDINQIVGNFSSTPQLEIKSISTPSVITSGTTAKLKEFSSSIKELMTMQSNFRNQLTPLELKQRSNHLYSIIIFLTIATGIVVIVLFMLHLRKPLIRYILKSKEPEQESIITNIPTSRCQSISPYDDPNILHRLAHPHFNEILTV